MHLFIFRNPKQKKILARIQFAAFQDAARQYAAYIQVRAVLIFIFFSF